jgi:hypothetical protein
MPLDTVPFPATGRQHYYFYGWAATKEILQKYLSSINKAHFSYEEIEIVSSAIFYMQRDIGRGEEDLKSRKTTRGFRMWAHFSSSTKLRQYFAMPKLPPYDG